MGVRFLHTADIHLKRDDPYRLDVLSWILSKAREIADGLIIAGDLFESDLDATFLRPRIKEIFQCGKEFPVLIIPGNHDFQSFSSDTYYGDNVFLFYGEPTHITVKEVKILGVPFQPEREFSQLMEKISPEEYFDIVIAHGTFYHRACSQIYMELGEDSRYMPIFSWDIEEKFKIGYLALGHYHSKFTHIPCGQTQVIYPGSPVATSRRSVGERFVSLVEIEKNKKITVQKVAVEPSVYWKVREWMVFPGREKEILTQIKEEIENLSNNQIMLRGEIRGFISLGEPEFREEVKRIENRYQAKFHHIELVSRARYWIELTRNPTIKLFLEKLDQAKRKDHIKKRALELTLTALEKLRT